ncbi:hypothetical protein ACLXBB_36885, partial [Pseudomonas aeruginosa]
LEIATVPLPSLDTLRLLYFGFIYRGKGIEDLLECLARRMRLPPGRVEVINHGNLEIATVPLPSLDTLRLLYFGFIYRGKGIEDLLE